MYRRIMLKLSGEALGNDGWLFNHQHINRVAGVLCQVAQRGIQLGVVIGGGNLWRGRQADASGMDMATADTMGMLGTIMNCLCMKDAVTRGGAKAQVMSALDMPKICDVFRADKADRALNEGDIVFFGGGLGNPCFTTDSAVALRAIELKADAILLAKNIDGVYSDDPRLNPRAELLRDLTYAQAQARCLKVMDLSAFALCADHRVPLVRVFGLSQPENILKVLDGETIGTVLHP